MAVQHFVLAIAALALAATRAPAQTGVAPPVPVQSQPLPPPAGAPLAPPPVPLPAPPVEPRPQQPAPGRPPAPEPVPPPPAPLAPPALVPVPPTPLTPPPVPLPVPPVGDQQRTLAPADPDATLAGRKGDPSDVDQILLVARPVLAVSGQSSWDQGFETLRTAQAKLRAEAARLGLALAGRPLTLFVETDDSGFRYEAMQPVAAPASLPALAEGIRLSESPAGAALRFVHVAPYDDIDSTYETITAYLEAKNIVVKDAFMEEYVGELIDQGDPNLEINVYVQPR